MSDYSERNQARRTAARTEFSTRESSRGTYQGVNGGSGSSSGSSRSGGGARNLWGVPDFFVDLNGSLNRWGRSQGQLNRTLLQNQRTSERLEAERMGLSTSQYNRIQLGQTLESDPELRYYYDQGNLGRSGRNSRVTTNYGPRNFDARYPQFDDGEQPQYDPRDPRAGQPGYNQGPAPLPPQGQSGPQAAPTGTGANAAPLPDQTGTSVAPTGTSTAAPGASTSTAAPGATTTTAGASGNEQPDTTAPSLAAAGGTRAGRFGVCRQRAPGENEIPVIDSNQVKPLQELLVAAGVSVGPMGADGKYGPFTHEAVRTIAARAGITNPHEIDFTNANDPETQRFMRALRPQNQQTQTVTPQGPSPEQARAAAEAQARAQADAQAQAEAQARAAADARVPAPIRYTPYDPRELASMSPGDRYRLAEQGLRALDELSNTNGNHSLEEMRDKMNESIRYANDRFGLNLPPINRNEDPFTERGMVALGLRVANEGGLARGDIYRDARTQEQMTQAAVVGIRALDRNVDREDPSRAISRFEREAGLQVDGIADPRMLVALEQAVRERSGLVVEAPQASVPPVTASRTDVRLPTSVSGGTDVQQPNGPQASPNAAPVVADRSAPPRS